MRRLGKLQGAYGCLQSTGGWPPCSHALIMISLVASCLGESQLRDGVEGLSLGASALLEMLLGFSPAEDQAWAGSAETPLPGRYLPSS